VEDSTPFGSHQIIHKNETDELVFKKQQISSSKIAINREKYQPRKWANKHTDKDEI
jgi:hypothetical protein